MPVSCNKDILKLVRETRIDQELELDGDADAAIWLPRLDTYLCDLKESQIRDGLHIFGESPQGRLRIDTLLALLRIPRGDGRGPQSSLLRVLAKAFGLGFDPLDCRSGRTVDRAPPGRVAEHRCAGVAHRRRHPRASGVVRGAADRAGIGRCRLNSWKNPAGKT